MIELIKFFIYRIKRDGISLEASALAFTSILALIPALTVVLSIFAMVPAFLPLKDEVMHFASENFLPVFTDAISEYITTFVEHAASMTLTGSLMLFVVSLMLIRAIDKTLNRIWRGGKRKIALTFAIYWTLLTVCPLAFGVIVWLTTNLLTQTLFYGAQVAIALKFVYALVPLLIEGGLILVFYTAIPVYNVRSLDALVGAIIVVIAFELSKKIFSAFILNFSDYEAIYGALAALPVLMMWIYINWWLILIGAEITAALGKVRDGQANKMPKLLVRLVMLLSRQQEAQQIAKDANLNINFAKFKTKAQAQTQTQVPIQAHIETQASSQAINITKTLNEDNTKA